MFWLQENLIWMKEVGNWTEVHTYWNYLLQNLYFKATTSNFKEDKSLVIERKIKKGIDETHHRSWSLWNERKKRGTDFSMILTSMH